LAAARAVVIHEFAVRKLPEHRRRREIADCTGRVAEDEKCGRGDHPEMVTDAEHGDARWRQNHQRRERDGERFTARLKSAICEGFRRPTQWMAVLELELGSQAEPAASERVECFVTDGQDGERSDQPSAVDQPLVSSVGL